MHATGVTASRSTPVAAGQLSVRTMASSHSLPGPIVLFVLVIFFLFLLYFIFSLKYCEHA